MAVVELVQRNKKLFCVLALFTVAAFWGSGFPITKIVLESGIKPNAMLSMRFMGAFALMYTFLKVKGIEITKEEIKVGLIAGTILFTAFCTQTVGAVYTTASKSAFITGANVVMVPFVYWIMSKEKPKVIVYFTSVLCFTGIGMLSLEKDVSINYGDMLTLACAFFYAFHMVVVGLNMKKCNPLVINCFQMLSAGILGVIGNLTVESGSLIGSSFTNMQIMAMAVLVVFNTFFCYLIQTFVQKYVPPSRVSLILSTEILFGAIFSVLLMGDLITLKIAAGGLLIFISIIIAEMKS
ncbi:MAG: DMT family transporter [Fusobacteriaceae bacterium]|nr:DMT family transporter [Fusobacteriaceae bacterium]